jgi:hypothetical protein
LNLYFLHVIVQYVCCILLLCWYTCNQSYIEQFLKISFTLRIFFFLHLGEDIISIHINYMYTTGKHNTKQRVNAKLNCIFYRLSFNTCVVFCYYVGTHVTKAILNNFLTYRFFFFTSWRGHRKYTHKLYVYYRQTQHIVYKNDGNMSLRNKHISYLPTVHTQWFILQFRVIKTKLNQRKHLYCNNSLEWRYYIGKN